MTRYKTKHHLPMLLKKLNLLVVGIGQTILQGGGIQSYPLPMAFNAHPKADGNPQRYLNDASEVIFIMFSKPYSCYNNMDVK